ncbi:uncharacterized protein LOC131946356 [Physella acuta]|uniref:uncharacterized protein LOC131946356 n=1 Tax=Physella acuta TaxID=109671 RepID=UPI0027DAC21A|nr:uncharacterized protein LOC131946356 [Physella acuta]
MEPRNGTSSGSVTPLLPDEAQFYINIWLVIVARTSLAAFGVASNMVNLTVFLRLGLKERVNLTLFCLSVCDAATCLCTAVVAANYVLVFRNFREGIDPSTLVLFFSWFRCLFADVATSLTVFISIERCFCITSPFVFNAKFSVTKTRTALVLIILFIVINYIPLYGSFKLEQTIDISSNTTITTFAVTEFYLKITMYNDYVLGIFLAIICLIAVFVCAVLMQIGLRKSSEFRNNAVNDFKISASEVSGKSRKNGYSRQDRKIVRMVLTLACLYMTTALPQIAISLAKVMFPELYSSALINIYYTVMGVGHIFLIANGSLTIFIYYAYNSSYRGVFKNKFF